jgi:UDP-2,3-diacylglucosamine hydrolase
LKPLINDALVIVSDIHLFHEDDERARTLLDLIARLDRDAVQYFVLLGDIFDFCFGASPYFHRKFARIGTALSDLAAKGVKVLFIQGNHEFSLGDLPWPGVELIPGHATKIRVGGSSIGLIHGDVLGAPWHYHWYRRFTHTRVFRHMGLMLPESFLDRLALSISKKSRARGRMRRVPHQHIISHLRAWYQQQNCDHGVVGHFHNPYHLKTPTGGLIMGLESWDRPNYLSFTEGVFKRTYL